MAVGAVVVGVLAGCCGCGAASEPSAGTPNSPPTPATADEEAAYLALLQKWATRDGYPMSDRETLLRAGHEACTFTNNGRPDQIEASYHVMQQFSLPAKEAQAVGVGAFETLCRADGSMPSVETSSAAAATSVPNYEGPPSAGPVQSQLMRVTLPAGTTAVGADRGTVPGIEIWHIPLDPAAAVDYLRPQLPTGPYDGLPACPVDVTHPQDGSVGITSWIWENAAGDNVQISVDSFQPPGATSPGPGSEVTITKGREDTPEPC
ncbi:hypothetical protein CG716_04855 [Mycolicibacterium sphagni]|uniref:DUF732 domain-containing protein n=2 Tax=Mycolicibacterium sphagni TaxID=1786 RepID=A0A255DR25_9MYCO|nr:hypothetical protein CG716_04855 [Mycolicibacterium sphagni]